MIVVNTETFLFDPTHPSDDETLQEFLDDFKNHSKRYYNLRTLHIKAPHAIMTGAMLHQLTKTYSCFTHLNLELLAFHTPKDDMWCPENKNIKNINISFVDGIAFPDSGTDILISLDKLKNLRNVAIKNTSPHRPNIQFPSRRLKNMAYVQGFNTH